MMKEFKGLRDLQEEVFKWTQHNFPNALPHMPLLGLSEEVGELSHAHLKGEQGIRHTKLEIYKMKKDAVGDIMIFLANYCNLNNLDLEDCVEVTWDEVAKRDWVNSPMGSDSKVTSVSDVKGEQLELDFKPFGLENKSEIIHKEWGG